MISYQTFESCIKAIKNIEELKTDVANFSNKYDFEMFADIFDNPLYEKLSWNLLVVLSEGMGLPKEEDIITWWIYESNFGTEDSFYISDPEYDFEGEFEIKNIRQLYDYCVFLSKKYNEEN